MDTDAMLKEFRRSVEARDGKAFAKLFTEDGVYHDVFYGAFKGHAKIAEMIDDWFYRTAKDFRWAMHDPVSDGTTLYVRRTRDVRGRGDHETSRRQDRRLSRGCEYRAGLHRSEVCAGAHRQDFFKAGGGVESASGDAEAFEGVIRRSFLPSLTRGEEKTCAVTALSLI